MAAGALSLAAALTAKAPPIAGSPTDFILDPEAPTPYVIGRTANSGSGIYRKEHDASGGGVNDRETFVVILSGAGPIEKIESFKADQTPVLFNGTGAATTADYSGWMWQRTQLGLCPEPEALQFAGGGAAAPNGWTTQHRLSGYAAAIWQLKYDTKGKHYQGGEPKPEWVLWGTRVYDPRQDSTYPGGSGPCRALDESTYVWAGVDPARPSGKNPYLQGLTWLLGRWQNGKRVMGVGAPIEGIDVAAYVEGANIADANGWEGGGVQYSADNKYEVLTNMLQAGGGEPLSLGAKISCYVNSPKVVLATATIADLTGGASVQTTQARRDRINGIIPRYRSEDHGWEVVPAGVVRAEAYLAMDGGERTKEADYPLVQNVDQAAQLARYGIENAREMGPIELPMRLHWLGYKPGDCIAVDIPELRLRNQPVVLTNRTISPSTGLPKFSARGETPGKHALALAQRGVAPVVAGSSGTPGVATPTTDEWALTGTTLTSGGSSIPAIVLAGAVSNPLVDFVAVAYRVYAAGAGVDENWIAAGIDNASITRREITSVTPGTQYEVSVRYAVNGLVGNRLILGPVTSGAMAVPGTAAGGVPAAAQADLATVIERINDYGIP